MTCEIFAQFDQMAMSYAREAFLAVSPRCAAIFNSFVGVWIAWKLVVDGLVKAELDWRGMLTQAAIFVVCGTAIETIDLYWEWVYDVSYLEMNSFAVALVGRNSTGITVDSLAGMLAVVEHEILRVFDIFGALVGDAGVSNGFNLVPIVGALLLAIPFLFVWGVFLAFILEGVFKLLAVTSVAPLLIAAAAFKPTRGFAVSGIRIVLGGFLTVLFAAVAMGFTVLIMAKQFSTLPVSQAGYSADIATWLFSSKYWAMFILGFVSVLFHLKAATLASNISGASDGPGAAAAVVGTGMGALGVIKAAGAMAARSGARAAGRDLRAAGKFGENTRNRLWEGGKANARASAAEPAP